MALLSPPARSPIGGPQAIRSDEGAVTLCRHSGRMAEPPQGRGEITETGNDGQTGGMSPDGVMRVPCECKELPKRFCNAVMSPCVTSRSSAIRVTGRSALTDSHQSQSRYKTLICEHIQGTSLRCVELHDGRAGRHLRTLRSGRLRGGRAQQNTDHAIAAGDPTNLAAVTIDDHFLLPRRPGRSRYRGR